MKNIFIYIGSQKGNNSNTVNFAKKILDQVSKKSKYEINYDIFTPRNTEIKYCRGCNTCFLKGTCILDENDDMKFIKEKMIKSDVIIWGSPVYAGHVSGSMKNFIDRISYWTHLMRLAGKPGVILSTASSNGNEFVSNYLYKIMTYIGIKVVGRFNVFVNYPKELTNEKFLKENITEYANVILDYINENKVLKTDNVLESIFSYYKNLMNERVGSKNSEYLYWENSNMLKCETFEEVIKTKILSK